MHLDLQLSHVLFTEAASEMMKTFHVHWLKNKIFFVADVCQNFLVYFLFPYVCFVSLDYASIIWMSYFDFYMLLWLQRNLTNLFKYIYNINTFSFYYHWKALSLLSRLTIIKKLNIWNLKDWVKVIKSPPTHHSWFTNSCKSRIYNI